MSDPNLLPTPTEPNSIDDTADSGRALVGKIARLPADLREQLNQRLLDGQTGSQILPWLNELPPVKAILAAQFNGVPVNHENLSNWRHNGYQRWLRRKDRVSATKELCQHAAELDQAGNGTLAPGAAAATVASGKILEFLDTADLEKTDPNDLVKCAAAASALVKSEQAKARIAISEKRLRQRDLALVLKRDKQQRDTSAVALRVLHDARAKEIEAAPWNNAEKIEVMGQHLFGDFWEPRPVPVEPPTQSNPQVPPAA
jgi:hypothetical protein